jgi:hypothetical protein
MSLGQHREVPLFFWVSRALENNLFDWREAKNSERKNIKKKVEKLFATHDCFIKVSFCLPTTEASASEFSAAQPKFPQRVSPQ